MMRCLLDLACAEACGATYPAFLLVQRCLHSSPPALLQAAGALPSCDPANRPALPTLPSPMPQALHEAARTAKKEVKAAQVRRGGVWMSRLPTRLLAGNAAARCLLYFDNPTAKAEVKAAQAEALCCVLQSGGHLLDELPYQTLRSSRPCRQASFSTTT